MERERENGKGVGGRERKIAEEREESWSKRARRVGR
jgi:hypothetical protein